MVIIVSASTHFLLTRAIFALFFINSPVDVHFLIVLLVVYLRGHELGCPNHTKALLGSGKAKVTNLYLTIVAVEEDVVTLQVPGKQAAGDNAWDQRVPCKNGLKAS